MTRRVYVQWPQSRVSHRTTTPSATVADFAVARLKDNASQFAARGAKGIAHTSDGEQIEYVDLRKLASAVLSGEAPAPMRTSRVHVLWPDDTSGEQTRSEDIHVAEFAWAELGARIAEFKKLGAVALEWLVEKSLKDAIDLTGPIPIRVRHEFRRVNEFVPIDSAAAQAAGLDAELVDDGEIPPQISHESALAQAAALEPRPDPKAFAAKAARETERSGAGQHDAGQAGDDARIPAGVTHESAFVRPSRPVLGLRRRVGA